MDNIFKFMNLENNEDVSFEDGLLYACEHDDLENAKIMIDNYAEVMMSHIYVICERNNLDILNLFIENECMDITEYNYLLEFSCEYDNVDMARIAIENGAEELIQGLRIATTKESHKVINMLILNKSLHKRISIWLTLDLLNLGYEIKNKNAKKAIDERKEKQEMLSNTLNNLHIKDYDINISEMINEYISYE